MQITATLRPPLRVDRGVRLAEIEGVLDCFRRYFKTNVPMSPEMMAITKLVTVKIS